MDITKTIAHIGLCAGYGGIELGLKRIIPNLRSVALCEIEAYACANLVAKMEAGLMDAAPIWTDIKTFPWNAFRDRVGILTGGYPCQPFSSAGKRLGADDPRHLWPFIAKGIGAVRPRICFFENVEGHITLGLSTVISDMEELGYQVAWGIFSAAECGAPHQRKRVFILAHMHVEGLERYDRMLAGCGEPRRIAQEPKGQACGGDCGGNVWPSRRSQPQHAWEPPRVLGNASVFDGTGQAEGQRQAQVGRTSTAQHKRQTQPALGRDADGCPGWLDNAKLHSACDNRTDELRLLGNGVVPATAERAFRLLSQELAQTAPKPPPGSANQPRI